MMYNQMDCPVCGNLTVVKSIKEAQRCRHCRRPILVTIVKNENKSGKKRFTWSVEPAEFPENGNAPKAKSLEKYMDQDVYGADK